MKQLKGLRELSYKQVIIEDNVKPFLIFAAFLLTFFISRLVVFLFPRVNLIIFEYHIHHFFFGFVLLAVANYIALMARAEHLRNCSAVLMGIGLGLVMDEVGILVTCGTAGRFCDPFAVYWSRLSFDIIIYVTLVFFVLIFLPPVWKRIIRYRGL